MPKRKRKKQKELSPRAKKRLRILIVAVSLLLAVTVGVLLAKQRADLQRRYPMKYENEVTLAAMEFELDPYLVYSLIRTESSFRPDVVSPSGAVGLMQLMPLTAQDMANRLEDDTYTLAQLTEPGVNIRLGCKYFRNLLDAFEQKETAIAAYNAGPGKVREWLNDPQYSADGVLLTQIPYAETRNYVKKVLNSYEMYCKIYGTAP